MILNRLPLFPSFSNYNNYHPPARVRHEGGKDWHFAIQVDQPPSSLPFADIMHNSVVQGGGFIRREKCIFLLRLILDVEQKNKKIEPFFSNIFW